jgi:hypothetical protein
MTSFLNIAPSSLVEVDRRFRGAYCIMLEPVLNLWNVGIFQRDYTALYPILASVRTWNITFSYMATAFHQCSGPWFTTRPVYFILRWGVLYCLVTCLPWPLCCLTAKHNEHNITFLRLLVNCLTLQSLNGTRDRCHVYLPIPLRRLKSSLRSSCYVEIVIHRVISVLQMEDNFWMREVYQWVS